jgi:hypothetical protein
MCTAFSLAPLLTFLNPFPFHSFDSSPLPIPLHNFPDTVLFPSLRGHFWALSSFTVCPPELLPLVGSSRRDMGGQVRKRWKWKVFGKGSI